MRIQRLKAPEPSEHEIQNALIARLRRAGWLVVRINGGGVKTATGFFRAYLIPGFAAHAGFPDLLALRGTHFRLFELKRRGGKSSEVQLRFAAFAERFGVVVEVVEGWAGMEAVNTFDQA